jgi:Domain of unknown function (DUF4190)
MVGRSASDGERASRHVDGLAVTAFVMGVLSVATSVIVVGILLGPAAAILGYLAYRRITSSAGMLTGRGLALAGLVLGVAGFAASLILPIVLLFGATQTGSSSSGP